MLRITTTAFIFHEDKLLLVFHKKMQCWMHVGGHLEGDELFDEALKREVREEVGLEIEILDAHDPFIGPSDEKLAVPLFVQGTKNGSKTDIAIDYVCKLIGKPVVTLQKEELEDYQWVKASDIDSVKTFPLLKKLAKEAFRIYLSKK